jgi:hypothetical protein
VRAITQMPGEPEMGCGFQSSGEERCQVRGFGTDSQKPLPQVKDLIHF